ncbi:hypothetical protein H3143_02180 [Mycoplasma tullyi]|uniref:DUF31 domain-containing protein n=1 Tax=Mycoplasma tullyi TaxID=1612150 RepID=A0A7D7XUM4_9MOLU|nr:hypothetical protein [Mycoplasma tullyi]QMT98294.1 hypothetical protein H3143_02180 [Mycoplasma tullyi]
MNRKKLSIIAGLIISQPILLVAASCTNTAKENKPQPEMGVEPSKTPVNKSQTQNPKPNDDKPSNQDTSGDKIVTKDHKNESDTNITNKSINKIETTNNKPINKVETTNTDNANLTTQEALTYYENHPELKKYDEERFNSETFLKDNISYIQQNLARSFALRWNYKDGSFSGGTTWLLDYQKVNDSSYKLFLATNYHVAVDIYRQGELEEYKQPARYDNPITDFKIGFDVQNSTNAGVKEWKEKTNYRNNFAYRTLKPEDVPKVIFLAQNFTENTKNVPNKNYYADFAVLEWDVNINSYLDLKDIIVPPNSDSRVQNYLLRQENIEWKLLTEHIKGAIKTFDEVYDKLTNKNLSIRNTDYKLPYASVSYETLDYARKHFLEAYHLDYLTKDESIPHSINKINELNSFIDDYLNNKTYLLPTNTYYAGFPFSKTKSETITNIPPGWENKPGYDDFDLNRPYITVDYDYNNKPVGDEGTVVFNKMPKSLFYGVVFETLSLNRVIGGMSGSLVTDRQGLPIGIFIGYSGSGSVLIGDKFATTSNVLYVPFVQNRMFTVNNLTVYPYNLIDGTDKSKYPKQLSSYREMLRKIYGVNGIKTKLFFEGV